MKSIVLNGGGGYDFFVLDKTTNEITQYNVPFPEIEFSPKENFVIFRSFEHAEEVQDLFKARAEAIRNGK